MGFCWGNRFLDLQGFPAWEASYIRPIKAGDLEKKMNERILAQDAAYCHTQGQKKTKTPNPVQYE